MDHMPFLMILDFQFKFFSDQPWNKKKQIVNIFSIWFTCFSNCLRSAKGGAKAKELQICFRFKVSDRTTKKELIMERLFPIRVSANPGRDCKEFDLNPSNKMQSSSSSSPQGIVSPNAILSAIDDEAFKNNLSEEEKAAFCKGVIFKPHFFFSRFLQFLPCKTFFRRSRQIDSDDSNRCANFYVKKTKTF